MSYYYLILLLSMEHAVVVGGYTSQTGCEQAKLEAKAQQTRWTTYICVPSEIRI